MIKATELTKRYGARTVVDNISFTVRPGVVTGFLGPNGAGKSTTMRLMLGLDHGGGRTTFDGRTYPELAQPLRSVGAFLDASSLHPARRARDHLRMLAAGANIPRSRVDEVLWIVGLSAEASGRPRGFSLGMRQRLGLAAALLGDPGCLLLDEPTNGLDPEGVRWMRDLLQGLAAEGRTVFVSSHLLSEMALMASDLIVIGAGEPLYSGPVQGFIAEHTRAEVVVRSPQAQLFEGWLRHSGYVVRQEQPDVLVIAGTRVEVVSKLAQRHGIEIREIHTRESSLEEAFLAATARSVRYRGWAA
jgi:ABC-2 type transport system ATP-binding protein